MFSQMWGALFARDGTGGVFWKTKEKVKGVTQCVHTCGHHWCPCWTEWLRGAALGTPPRRGDATQTLPPAAEAKIVPPVHLTGASGQHGTGMGCQGGNSLLGPAAHGQEGIWMGCCSNVGDWHQDLSLWAKTQDTQGVPSNYCSLPFLLSHPKDRAATRAQALASCSGLRSKSRTKRRCSAMLGLSQINAEKASFNREKNQLFVLNEMRMKDRTWQNIFILIFAFQRVAFLSPAFSHH